MTKYERPAIGASMVLVVADWIFRLLSWDISGLGDGALLWVRLLFIAFLLFGAALLLWAIVALASAGLGLAAPNRHLRWPPVSLQIGTAFRCRDLFVPLAVRWILHTTRPFSRGSRHALGCF